MSFTQTLTAFRNEPLLNFSDSAVRAAVENALKTVDKELGRVYPLWIGGKAVRAKSTSPSINPSQPREIIGRVQQAGLKHADAALNAATAAFQTWRFVPQAERSKYLVRMGALMREQRYEFMAWMILEVGKSWAEADADVAEAIDFLEYYARLALEAPPAIPAVASENNSYAYLPLGPVVVIPPWNFPLAIMVGMTTAAIVTGNTVVLKPSSQSPVIASRFMELVNLAAVPAGVINLLTGAGRTVGDFLVGDRRTRMVAFTGSKEVGLHINQLAAKPTKGQIWIKRVIAEMGGKNAIVVDESADLEKAVDGVLFSAFGYQGQKCSACSRAYVHAGIYEKFKTLLVEKTCALRVGPSRDPDHFMGPVVSADAMRKILQYIELGKRQGRLLAGGTASKPAEGYFIQPTIFEGLKTSSRLIQEEIFGPVLVLSSVPSFAEALVQANATAYGLTGSVYSHDEMHLEQARKEFFCGNLYLNRKSTGAWVGGHPFGGFNLSGTDSKAGGPDYLLLFQQAQAISRKL